MHKHRLLDPQVLAQDDVPVVVTSKDPFSWLVSVYRWTCHVRKTDRNPCASFEVYVRKGHVRGSLPPLQKYVETYQYNLMVELEVPRVHVRYCDFLTAHNREVRRVITAIDMMVPPDIRRIRNIAMANHKVKARKFDASYYKDHRYLRKFDGRLFDHVVASVPEDLMALMGYDFGELRKIFEEVR